ncbi:MAG: glutathione S-transferase [Pseudomonadota bacterium]
MTYQLFYGHPSYSSWSLRAWLLFEKFDLPRKDVLVDIYEGGKARDLAPVAPATTVPVIKCPDGTVVGDSLAIAETLHERHPDAGLWPKAPSERALARWVTAEMHSGFTALRGACPMVLTHQITDFEPSDAVIADMKRIETLWSLCKSLASQATEGPWLFGAYSIADAFYAPVAMRIAGYGLAVSPDAAAYVAAHLGDPAVMKWRSLGLASPINPPPYNVPGTKGPWPV